jgi:hypothetical protein
LERIALQAAFEAIGKKTYCRERGHCQRHRHHQKAQVTGAHITPEGTPTQEPRK